eukprot:scaffold25672_cov64-Skeletonema_dohrnii-CCMP3373.AAC.1
MISKQQWCKDYSARCPLIRGLEKEQQLKPKYVRGTKNFGSVWRASRPLARCAHQEDSVDEMMASA